MIRRIIACLLALTLTGLGFAADDPKPIPDEPPTVLKKKKKAEPAPDEKPALKKAIEPKDKVKPKDAKPKEEAPEPGADPKEVLERINKHIRESEERLGKKDAGDSTRQVQRDIVQDLDKLIERMKQPPPNPQGGGSSSAPNGGQDQQPQSSSSRSSRNGRQRHGKNGSKSDSKNSQANQNGSGNQGGAGRDSQGPATPKADVLKDVWGHLPEMMRLEMDAYSREQFAARYGELLKQYYQTIAEKGRRTENER